MRSAFAAVAFATAVSAHYNFEALIVNDNVTSAYEYVRQTTNANSPVTDINSTSFICNQGGLDTDIMAKTSTYSVKPGDQVGFTVNVQIGHPGPLSVYLSKAPDGTSAKEYKGDGDWFKVYELTTGSITDQGLQWATYVDGGIRNFTFTLPDSLPSGDYLMRAEHIALHGAGSYGGAQYYMGCAQLSVSGSGSGSPSPTVRIPGVYTGNEPGILINIYYPAPTNYTAPGPKTWPNACEDHTANYAEQTSDGDCTGDGSSPSSSSSSSSSSSGSSPATSSPGAASSVAAKSADSASTVSSSSSGSPGSGSSKGSSCASKTKKKRAVQKWDVQKRDTTIKKGLPIMPMYDE